MSAPEAPDSDVILGTQPLGFQWGTADPFLFCVHHLDRYPAGNERFGPKASLEGRDLGQDFQPRDGFRMYHGTVVPGFPQHPHRGFETVTIVRKGRIDHSDSLGAAARYGDGDVQWLTAGAGVVHAEMFPLLRQDGENTLELFQIWLNLPAAKKLSPPSFLMLWRERIPRQVLRDEAGRTSEVTVIAGRLGDLQAPAPPPDSYAAQAEADVAIWTLRLSPGARLSLPPARPGTGRTLYAFSGSGLRLAGRPLPSYHAAQVRPDVALELQGGDDESELLLLQGRPIGEPVAQYGPFVMNTRAELQQAFADYRRTEFGGWPWPSDDPVHGRDEDRFARRGALTERP